MIDQQDARAKWEVVVPEGTPTYRLKVPGGWLYRVVEPNGTSMAFAPEPSQGMRHATAHPRKE